MFLNKSWLMTTIKLIITSTNRIMLQHKYVFENTRDVAIYITKLIKWNRYDFVNVLDKENNNARTGDILLTKLGPRTFTP